MVGTTRSRLGCRRRVLARGLVAVVLGCAALAPVAVITAAPALASVTMTAEDVAGTGRLQGIDCADADTCLAVSPSGGVVPITGGTVGALQSGTGLSKVACPTVTTCVGVAGGSVVSISNGWTGASQSVPDGATIDGVGCADATVCYVVGNSFATPSVPYSGIVALVTDGTPSTAQRVPGTSELFDVACTSATTCVAVGSDPEYDIGVVVPIVDGVPGAAQTVSGTRILRAVTCADAHTCYAIGGNPSGFAGIIVPITDGVPGAASVVSGPLAGVDCRTATDCVAVGRHSSNRGIMVTFLNGASTSARFVPDTVSLDDVSCTSVTTCFAVGEGSSGAGVVDTMTILTTVTADVTGSQVVGSSSPSFSTSTTPPAGHTFGGTLTCTTVDDPAVTISPALAVGSFTLNGSSCSGLTVTGPDAAIYDVAYSGGPFTVAALPAPTGVVATATSSTRIALTWDAVAGATSYEIYRSESEGGPYTSPPKVSTSNGYANTGRTPGTTYYYVVRAVSAAGSSVDSAEVSATTPAGTAAPTNLAVTATTSTKVTLSWDSVSDATSYQLRRSTTPGGSYAPVASTAATTLTDTTAAPGTAYYYVVAATGPAGTSANSNEATATTLTVPSPPADVVATPTAATKVSVTWDSVGGATAYEVWHATTAGGAYTKKATVSGTSYLHTTVAPGTANYYVVRSVTATGTSANSAQATATTPSLPVPPTNVVATRVGLAKVTVTWSPVTAATAYEVWRATVAGGPFTKKQTVTGTSYTDNNAPPTSTYFYVVRTVDPVGTSPNSAEATP